MLTLIIVVKFYIKFSSPKAKIISCNVKTHCYHHIERYFILLELNHLKKIMLNLFNHGILHIAQTYK